MTYSYKEYIAAKKISHTWEWEYKQIREQRKKLKRNQPYSSLTKLDVIWGHRMDLCDLMNYVNKIKITDPAMYERHKDMHSSLIADSKKRLLQDRLIYKNCKDETRNKV